ncbi:hypothetical protein [uncultured Citrobacter sp.]|uniref:hypothetical protein n=1 Tax=uncultured Citrobacter sp. TaxID=200446 RepID=UPI002591A263|nr:hypothetical protein [uncultured Citrobacter sp.]
MQEPVHIMVDNETLSVLPNAHIAQVGLVRSIHTPSPRSLRKSLVSAMTVSPER